MEKIFHFTFMQSVHVCVCARHLLMFSKLCGHGTILGGKCVDHMLKCCFFHVAKRRESPVPQSSGVLGVWSMDGPGIFQFSYL